LAFSFAQQASERAAPAEAKQYRYQHHHLYWPGHYFRPYADTPGLTGLIHHRVG
jgi:hypothetical protein